ncbi:hypothetical protein [Mangrovibacterium diazotrophicum]|uniref:Uncharacterized protein n=1 Tax=Mangrovibacterium diazotrophicum TaxID=1261403 RepID=A0A419VX20_9BACT|nr:hypothetical protein [Mangrovibacterium diazotrophicum]RKD87767.1 hypothetical protein BC643_3774 [Mangrovibacterium diazotrophicum]
MKELFWELTLKRMKYGNLNDLILVFRQTGVVGNLNKDSEIQEN